VTANLSLFLLACVRFHFELRNDFVAGESFGKVEHFNACVEANHYPISKHLKVHDLHIWTELHRTCDLLLLVIPDAKFCRWIFDVGASTYEEEDV